MILPKDYDQSLLTKFNTAFKGMVVWASTEKAFKIASSKDAEAKVKLPFVTLHRLGYTRDTTRYNMPGARKGWRIVAINVNNTYVKARVLPIKLPYKLTVWAGKSETNDHISSELSFFMELHPSFTVQEREIITDSFSETVIKGALDGTDSLSNTNVTAITSLNDGSRDYTVDVDFTLENDQINWDVEDGAEPYEGAAYTVTYDFRHIYEAMFDILMEDESNNTDYGWEDRGRIYTTELSFNVDGVIMLPKDVPQAISTIQISEELLSE